MVELSHGLFRLSLYANLGLKVEFSGRLKKLEQLAKPNIFSFSLVSKAESSDKTLTGIFMNKLGLKEPGFENRRAFSKKAGEPQKLLRFQKFTLVNVSQSRTVKETFKTV